MDWRNSGISWNSRLMERDGRRRAPGWQTAIARHYRWESDLWLNNTPQHPHVTNGVCHFHRRLLLFICNFYYYTIFITNFWSLSTKPRQVVFSFLSLLFFQKKRKKRKKRKTTKDNLPLLWQFIFNSLITFRHTHGNLVLKCWQRSVLTKTSTGSFLWSPVFVAWLRWHLFGSISGYHGNHLLLLSKIDGPHTFAPRAVQKLLIEDA